MVDEGSLSVFERKQHCLLVASKGFLGTGASCVDARLDVANVENAPRNRRAVVVDLCRPVADRIAVESVPAEAASKGDLGEEIRHCDTDQCCRLGEIALGDAHVRAPAEPLRGLTHWSEFGFFRY